MEHLQHSSPRIPSRKQALFAGALALFSRMPDAFAASDDPELEAASIKVESLEARSKESSGRVAQAGVRIMQAQTALELAQSRFRKKGAVAKPDAAHARPSHSNDASASYRLHRRLPNSISRPKGASTPIGITAGSTFSLFSSGDNPVQSPGVFGRVNFQVPGITHRRGSTVEIEGSYADLDQALSDTHATFEPRDSARKLDGDMVNFSAGAGLDVPLASSDTIGANLHIGTHFGASVLYIDGGTDVAVAKKPDSQGRRALANMPSRTVIFPHTSARAEIAIVTRDDISGALGGYFTLSALPTQNRAGDPDGSHTPFVDSGLRASLGFQF